MSAHDTVNVIYWAIGAAIIALLALWIALNVAHQREHRQRVARYDAARQGHWESVKAMLPGCAGEVRPEDDPCIVTGPSALERCSTPGCRRIAGHIGWCDPAPPGNRTPQRGETP